MALTLACIFSCFYHNAAIAYPSTLVGWYAEFNGRKITPQPTMDSACQALLQELRNTKGLNEVPPYSPFRMEVLLHPIDNIHYYCILKSADSPPDDVWGTGWAPLSNIFKCDQPHSELYYPNGKPSPYTQPECKCVAPYFEKNGVCVAHNIRIDGPSVTNALPSLVGPILQTVTVDLGGEPAPGILVELRSSRLGEMNFTSFTGVTDENGEFEFQYIPPFSQSINIKLTAQCATCENVASKNIRVLAVDFDDGENDGGSNDTGRENNNMCIR
ncbi:MAG: carboxypeptidase-like regulatory domain-containing protein [Burkholderiaceae bacterium]|nr:carboxypeptidase-like regulatory domain-containing protein [Burkholderiaceae bacterium]